MKSRVFPEGYIAKETQDIIKEYVKTGVIKDIEIPCASDMDCLYLYTCVNHQCKAKEYTQELKSERQDIAIEQATEEEKQECRNNKDCGGLGFGCIGSKCIKVSVRCSADSDCPADRPICDQYYGLCLGEQ